MEITFWQKIFITKLQNILTLYNKLFDQITFYLFSVLYYDLLSILGIPNDSPETTLRRGMAGIQFNIGILDLAKEENMLLF